MKALFAMVPSSRSSIAELREGWVSSSTRLVQWELCVICSSTNNAALLVSNHSLVERLNAGQS